MATNLRNSPKESTPVIDRLLADIARADDYLPEQVLKLRRQIAMYERIYGLSSGEMQSAVEDGRMVENHDVCEWLLKLELLHHVASPR